MAQFITLLICIPEMYGSGPGRYIHYTDRVIRFASPSKQMSGQYLKLLTQWSIPSKSFPIHYSTIIVLSELTNSIAKQTVIQ
jgi:hypothetical protein